MSDWKTMKNSKSKYGRYLASREWGLLKEQVHKRAGGKCERCKNNKIDAVHHLTYERIYCERLDDLQAICTPCHEFTHGKSNVDPAAVRTYDASDNPNRLPEPADVERRTLRYLASLADLFDPYASDHSPFPDGITSLEFTGLYRSSICHEISKAPWRRRQVSRDYLAAELDHCGDHGNAMAEIDAVLAAPLTSDADSLIREFHEEADRYRLSACFELGAKVLRNGASADRALTYVATLGAHTSSLWGKIQCQVVDAAVKELERSRHGGWHRDNNLRDEGSPYATLGWCAMNGVSLWLEDGLLCCSGLEDRDDGDWYFHQIDRDSEAIRRILRVTAAPDKTTWGE